MAIIDDIYDAVDDYGLVTSSEARELGVSNQALVQLSRRGKLERVERGVYRVPVWPYQEQAPYATAVKAAGNGAYLFGESVLALLNLVPTDPRRMWVAVSKRVRRNLGKDVMLIERRPADETTFYEAIPCQRVKGAIVSAAHTMGRERAEQAADEALRQGYISQDEKHKIEKELDDAEEA